ncbi:hypothetical protein [Arthrobacter sedimenti]|uniref:hypothetical protein n=1 Tax=Arthrobacter sedimenti TaxID=2694931 RepID=UPI000B36183C|nr:hypothetical protein [Arthrobacter sedimenti]OUM45668.1 hypothetical protein B8W73_00160 [Arthrobacter agilis]
MMLPQVFALQWHRALFEQDMAQVWSSMTTDFRRVVAQVALGKDPRPHGELDPIVDELSAAVPAREDLQQFFSAACSILQNSCRVSPDSVGAGTSTRIEAPAFEVVRLYMLEDLAIDAEGNYFLQPGHAARALTLVLSAEEDESWRMAGIGGVLIPGWPPTLDWESPAEA